MHQLMSYLPLQPRLFLYYTSHLQALLDNDETTPRNFSNSVWASATFNFGPQTAYYKHRDPANIPSGWCGVTSLSRRAATSY